MTSEGDAVVGVILATIFIFGVPANILALLYFLTRRSRKPIRRFFKTVYIIIAAVDLLICAAVVPVMEAAFAPERAGIFFNNPGFCRFWTVAWIILPNLSIFLIFQLSCARLGVLCNKTLRLKPEIACPEVHPPAYLAPKPTSIPPIASMTIF